MRAADFIVDYFMKKDVMHAFGIPGGVLLDLLDAMESNPGFTPHLCYHEQAAAFSALGYAQASGRVAIAYGTRGPGFTNLITSIADAYYDSIPVIFVTAHAVPFDEKCRMRVAANQEVDHLSFVHHITKYAKRVETLDEVLPSLEEACCMATTGRKGPVVLDFLASLFMKEISTLSIDKQLTLQKYEKIDDEKYKKIIEILRKAEKPVFLIGEGIRQAQAVEKFEKVIDKIDMPIISSSGSQDIVSGRRNYYGYIGSHGIRYANRILSDADAVISLGNRLCVPVNSKSYSPLLQNTQIIRIDIDSNEYERKIPNCIECCCDVKEFMETILENEFTFTAQQRWKDKCNEYRRVLKEQDVNEPVLKVLEVLKQLDEDDIIVSDVGNNQYWLSRAYELGGIHNRILYSRSFGTLGCSIGKSIGVYFSTGKRVICFAGDQGMQLNIQELQFVVKNRIPITFIVVNNCCSGMIRDSQIRKGYMPIHTTPSDGYDAPDFKALFGAYGIKAYDGILKENPDPYLVELQIESDIELIPFLPIGKRINEQFPFIEEE